MNQETMYDAVVVGGGPAGLTSAIYLARAHYRVLVVEKERFGGQITITAEVVNYPGVEKMSGAELTEQMRKQAENFGAEFLLAEVVSLDFSKDVKIIKTTKGTLEAHSVLLATGAHPRRIGFEGEKEYQGHGVAYCATCDGEFFTGKEVFVVGGGFAAAEEAVFLTRYAKHVTILVRKDKFGCAQEAADKAINHEKITVLFNSEVVKVEGDSVLRKITYRNNVTKEETVFETGDKDTFGVFVFAGYEPSTDLIKDIAELNSQGYVITNSESKTTQDGLYAAGDVCIKALRQVVTATGDGALAATQMEKYISNQREKTGLTPVFRAPEKKSEEEPKGTETSSNELIDANMKKQLEVVFAKLTQKLTLEMHLDDRNVSKDLVNYMNELAKLTDKLEVKEIKSKEEGLPFVRVIKENGMPSGITFHGAPGGHEFTSFVLGLYNAGSAGQVISEEAKKRIEAINKPVHMNLLVSLSCTMCPDLVTAAERIVTLNSNITMDTYDLNHFNEMKEKYNVMSVPAFILNDGKLNFGKKNVEELVSLIENA